MCGRHDLDEHSAVFPAPGDHRHWLPAYDAQASALPRRLPAACMLACAVSKKVVDARGGAWRLSTVAQR
jgi:hypothetical protein